MSEFKTPENKRRVYRDWYERNKDSFAAKRKKRYQEDPAYREAARDRARKYRADKNPELRDKPPEYCISPKEASEMLDVPVYTIRKWVEYDYCPQPRSFGGRLYYTENQVSQLEKLAAFFTLNPVRDEKAKEALQEVVSQVFANW